MKGTRFMNLLKKLYSYSHDDKYKIIKIFGKEFKFRDTNFIIDNLSDKVNYLDERLSVITDSMIESVNQDIKYEHKFIQYDIKHLILDKRLKFFNSDKKPKVVILTYNYAHWSMNSVVQAMLKEKFDVKIVVSPENDVEETIREETYIKTCEFFEKLGYNVIRGWNPVYDLDTDRPDIIIYQTHWMGNYLPEYNIENWYNKVLCISIPYGIGNVKINNEQFNQLFHNMVWFICEEAEPVKKMAEKYSDNKGINAIVTGYPKLDDLYLDYNVDEYWKNPDLKKIIYAPHYSINTNWNVDMSTFHLYYKKIYDYVKEHENIEMQLKPHPLLKTRCILKNVMSEKDYNEYTDSWNNLPNGGCADIGNYMGLFSTSDALLLDSLSFTAEYMCTKKPICFINKYSTKEELLDRFNEFGQMVMENCYIAQNWDDIQKFIDDVVIAGNDYMYEQRCEFFNKYLDVNTGHVGEYIVNKIKEELFIK